MVSSENLLLSFITLALVWVMMATSSIVFFEPAIYDALGLGIIIVLFALGLRLPVGIGLPLSLLGIYLITNIVAAMVTEPVETIRSIWIRTILVFNWLLFASLVYHMPKRFFPTIWHGYVTAGCIAVFIGLGACSGLF